MKYLIKDECIGCGLCRKKCPLQAIVGDKKIKHEINQSLCDGCGICFNTCNRGAIYDSCGKNNGKGGKKNNKRPVAWIDIDKCLGCKNCIPNCDEAFAISFSKKFMAGHSRVDPSVCLGCRSCVSACPHSAISIKEIDK